MNTTPDILIIDDDVDFCRMLTDSFMIRNLRTQSAQTFKEGLERIRESKPKMVLLDNRLPDGSGINMITEIKKNHASTRVMMISGESLPDFEQKAIAAGADYFCAKPFDFQKLSQMVQFWIKKSFGK
jgi:DNA-binding NtrC family response regulator